MKSQTIGVEIEMTGITREKAAEVAANFLGGELKKHLIIMIPTR